MIISLNIIKKSYLLYIYLLLLEVFLENPMVVLWGVNLRDVAQIWGLDGSLVTQDEKPIHPPVGERWEEIGMLLAVFHECLLGVLVFGGVQGVAASTARLIEGW